MKTNYSLELININKSFDNSKVVENLDLSIPPGKVTCFWGPLVVVNLQLLELRQD